MSRELWCSRDTNCRCPRCRLPIQSDAEVCVLPGKQPVNSVPASLVLGAVVLHLTSNYVRTELRFPRHSDQIDAAVLAICGTSELDAVPHPIKPLGDKTLEFVWCEGSKTRGVFLEESDELRGEIDCVD